MSAERIDTLIEARWIAPVEPAGVIFEEHALAVRDGKIVDLLPSADAQLRYQATERVELSDHLLIPGLVNAHTHAAMTLMRGLADDLPLMPWLTQHVWPVEGALMSAEFVRDGTELAAAEMLRGGITSCQDMYFFPDVAAAAFEQMGMRAVVGLIVIEFPSAWAGTTDEYFEKATRVHDQWRGHSLIGTSLAPHAPYTVSDGSFQRIRTLSDQFDIRIQCHVHETAQEIVDARQQTNERPLARLKRLGVLSEALTAVHMTQLTESEIEQCARAGVAIAHCPESNLKLASGFCPVDALLRAGIAVALGTDGCASNNDLDLLGEARSAAFLAKGVSADASSVDAHQALRMATLGGAQALGLADRIGSLVPGKWADITAVSLSALELQPVYNPVSHLIYAAGRQHVSDVWVGGRRRVADGALIGVDSAALSAKAQRWAVRARSAQKAASEAKA
ncbi:MAG: TRZ/ATZ family hydrolase [Xanthomonadales bacterium]|nr:TRZ/ATZ family hydrolase [Xanthomonadales bacterium]